MFGCFSIAKFGSHQLFKMDIVRFLKDTQNMEDLPMNNGHFLGIFHSCVGLPEGIAPGGLASAP